MLELAAVVALARQCEPTVAAETLVSLVYTESHFDPYAIGVNTKGVAAPKPSNRMAAIAAARSLIARATISISALARSTARTSSR